MLLAVTIYLIGSTAILTAHIHSFPSNPPFSSYKLLAATSLQSGKDR